MKLTGKTGHRRSWLGKIVLTVEVGGYAMWAYERHVRWGTVMRDATAEDMAIIELIKLQPSRAARPDPAPLTRSVVTVHR